MRPGDFQAQLEALKREIARRPTPTRSSMANRNNYLNEVPTLVDNNNSSSPTSKRRTSSSFGSSSPKQQNSIRRDSQGKIVLTPSPSPNRKYSTNERRRSSTTNIPQIHIQNNNEHEEDENTELEKLRMEEEQERRRRIQQEKDSQNHLFEENQEDIIDDDDEDLEIRIQAASQRKKFSPSYSAQQRAAARKHQQIFDADELKTHQKKTDESDAALSSSKAVSARNNRIATFVDNTTTTSKKNLLSAEDFDSMIRRQNLQRQQQLGVGGWMQISDGDVRLTWTRRFLRWEPTSRQIFSSAREGIIGKAIFELVDPEEHRNVVERINVREHHAQIVSPFQLTEFIQKKRYQQQHNQNNHFGIISSSNSNNVLETTKSKTSSSTPPKFYLLNISQDHFYGNRKSSFSSNSGTGVAGFVLLEPPDPAKHSKNGVTLTMQSYTDPNVYATVVLCAETQVHAVMWVSALKHMQIDAEIC